MLDYDYDFDKLKPIMMERIRYHAGEILGPDVVAHMRLDRDPGPFDNICRGIVLRLEAGILSEKLGKEKLEVKVEVPATWWQHFKRDVLKCKKIKTKVIEKTTTLNVKALYPQIPEVFPDTPIVYIAPKINFQNEWVKTDVPS